MNQEDLKSFEYGEHVLVKTNPSETALSMEAIYIGSAIVHAVLLDGRIMYITVKNIKKMKNE